MGLRGANWSESWKVYACRSPWPSPCCASAGQSCPVRSLAANAAAEPGPFPAGMAVAPPFPTVLSVLSPPHHPSFISLPISTSCLGTCCCGQVSYPVVGSRCCNAECRVSVVLSASAESCDVGGGSGACPASSHSLKVNGIQTTAIMQKRVFLCLK